MSKPRNPFRDKCFELYVSSNGLKTPGEIAKQCGVRSSDVRKWKYYDKWDEHLPRSEDEIKKRTVEHYSDPGQLQRIIDVLVEIADSSNSTTDQKLNACEMLLKYVGTKTLNKSMYFTEKDWKNSLNYFDHSCAYCGMTDEFHLEKYGESLNQEHFIPNSKGGTTSKNNIIPACKSCNSSKYNNDFYDWYPKQSFFDKERETKILTFAGSLGDDQYAQTKKSEQGKILSNLA